MSTENIHNEKERAKKWILLFIAIACIAAGAADYAKEHHITLKLTQNERKSN